MGNGFLKQPIKKLGLTVFVLVSLAACNNKQSFDLAQQQQQFGQDVKYITKVDILWVTDTSGSMLTYRQRLSAQIDALMDDMIAKQMDFNIGWTSMDMGKDGDGGQLIGTPKYLNFYKTPDIKNVAAQRFLFNNANNQQNLTRGLQSMQTLLTPSNLVFDSAGFSRDDALLIVIFVTDEDDNSANKSADYTAFLDSIKKPFKDGSRSWIANFIGVTDVNTCKDKNGLAIPGTRYMDLANTSGGVSARICDADLRVALSNIKTVLLSRLTDFHLDQAPVVDTIRVYVNGVLVPQDANNGWTYIADGYTIHFNGNAVPNKATDTISVDFKPAGVK